LKSNEEDIEEKKEEEYEREFLDHIIQTRFERRKKEKNG